MDLKNKHNLHSPRFNRQRLPSQKRQRRVFISYARRDSAELAQRLRQDLLANGFDVWLDTARIRGGATWSVEIEQALDNTDVVLALISTASFASDVCRGEQLRSLRSGKRVIPLLVQHDADRPVYLECKNYRDFSRSEQYKHCFRLLLSDIGKGRVATLQPSYLTTDYETVPPLPLGYVERPDLLAPLRAALINDDVVRQVAVTGVRGMGGVGKTVLAQALCRRDPVVQAAFPDGIVWVTVGQEPGNLVTQMRDVARALGEPTVGFDNPGESTKRLRAILGRKAALLVLDDVWEARFVEPFRTDAPRCKILFTTREAGVAAALGAPEYCVDVLEPTKALELLARYAQTTAQTLPSEAHQIIQECGYLPLAVAMVGAIARGKPSRWNYLLQKLRSANLGQIELMLPSYPHANLLKAFQVSLNSLEPELRRCYYDLAVFPEDIAIPKSALGVLWNCDDPDAQRIAERFVDASLAKTDGQGRLLLHDLQRDFVRSHSETRLVELHSRLLTAYASKCNGLWSSGPGDGYFFQHLVYHLHGARRDAEIQRLLVTFDWLRAKLAATSVQYLIGDYERFADGEGSHFVGEAIKLSAHILDKDPSQLRIQLTARLYNSDSQAIKEMLAQARCRERGWWLDVVLSCLAGPGDPLQRTVRAGETIKSVAITPDAGLALSGGEYLTLWDLATGHERQRIKVPSGYAYAIAITPDGTRCVSASAGNGPLTTWDLKAGHAVHVLQTSGMFHAVSVASDGSRVVVADYLGLLKAWDLETGQKLYSRRADISTLVMTPDGRRIVSAGSDNDLKIWDAQTGRRLAALRGHRSEINALAVTTDGTRLVSGSFDETLKYWDLETGQELRSLDLRIVDPEYPITAVAVTPDQKRVVTASFYGSITIWDFEVGAPLRTWRWHRRPNEGESVATAIAITPDCKYAISASHSETLQLWNLDKRQYVDSLPRHDREVANVLPSPDYPCFVSVSDEDKTLKYWDLGTARNLSNLGWPSDDSVEDEFDNLGPTTVVPGGRVVVTPPDKAPEMWQLEMGQRIGIFDDLGGDIISIAATPDGKQLLCGRYSGPLELWDLDVKKKLRTLHPSAEWYEVTITPDGKHGVAVVSPTRVKMWQLETGKVVRTFACQQGRSITALLITGDSELLVAGGLLSLQVWELGTGRKCSLFKGKGRLHFGGVLIGDRKLTASYSAHRLTVWHLELGVEVCHFDIDADVTCCACTPDNSILLVGDSAGGVHALRLYHSNQD
jgi:WD40 repeat protein